jgi:hypothetical protein
MIFEMTLKKTIPNLLLIAGTGTKAGKTTVACRIIEQFSELKITAVKITPHFHETTPGLILLEEGDGYAVYEEKDSSTSKDTSRMLKAGAVKVYFAKVWDNKLPDVFEMILKLIPDNVPIVCESPALRYYTDPGIFIIVTSDTVVKHKDISNLMALPHVMIKLDDLSGMKSMPVEFKDGRWVQE